MDSVNYVSTADHSVSLIEGYYQAFAFQRHYHLDYHFGLILEGQQQFVYNGEQHIAGPGEIILMPPDELHDGRAELATGYQVVVFAVEPEWFGAHMDFRKAPQCLSFSELVVRDPSIFQHIKSAYKAFMQSDLCQLAQDCLPYESLAPLVERYGHSKEIAPQRIGRSTLASLRDFMMAHLSEPIHLQQLAELCDLTPSQFQRHFKATVGITPYAWLTRLRLEQAMKLLKANRSGTDVAHQVGFYDQAHFSKSFKQTFGISPSLVR